MKASELVGRWQLAAWTATDEANTVTRPSGDQPQGCLVYTPGGWMSGQLALGDRRDFSASDALGGTEVERTEAYSSYVAYCGEYWLEGDSVVHMVRMSLVPNWVGQEQRRFVELSGDRLVLRTPPMAVAGKDLVNRLHWIRAE